MLKQNNDIVRTSRNILWYITFLGFIVNYMYRVNLNIAIVDMIQVKSTKNQLNVTNQCFSDNKNELIDNVIINNNNNSETYIVANKTNINYSFERMLLNEIEFKVDHKGFKWDEYQQGLVLGSFFWLHCISQIPGGILARWYGTKLVFGLSNLLSCVLCFFMPICSYWDYRALLFLRAIQGLISGLSWPAMTNLTAQWIPPNERSKFMSAYLGSSVGIALFYPLFGYIISQSSWEWVFHISGLLGVAWSLAWYFLVFDSPALHPRIDPAEREYIQKALGSSVQKEKISTPWRFILTDRAVWMIVIAQFGNVWGLYTYMTQAPTYFKNIHGWGIQMTGFLSGLPHVMRMLFSFIFSIFGDFLLTNNKMTQTNVRKMAGFICLIVSCFLSIALSFSGCNSLSAVVFLTLATATQGAVSTGPLANIVDISPNYASVIMGLSGMISGMPGFISPIIVGMLTFQNQTITQWKYVFLIAAGMLFISGILYVLFGDAKLKHWNDPNKQKITNCELTTKENLLPTSLIINEKELENIANILEDIEEDNEQIVDDKKLPKENTLFLH